MKKRGDEVIVPAFSFIATANAVLFCDAKPVLSADMNPILDIAVKNGLHVIGGAAQAHGAKYDGKMIGSFGDAECFSFYPTKNMTTGEGGMITTNNEELAEMAYSIRNHGRERTKWGYEHGRLGYNYRMTDVAAAIGIEQLKKLPKFNDKRIENAKYFNENLAEIEGIDNDLKNSEKMAEEVLSLPVHPALERHDLYKIVEVVNGVFQHPCK